jgi:hypothetical protein
LKMNQNHIVNLSFEFEKVICTDLLLQDNENSLTVREIDVRGIGVYLTRN